MGFAESGGTAGNCLEAIGSDGLSFDDLYFIFGDEQHLWSELNSACDAVDIEIAIPDTTGGTYDFFKSVVFANGGAFREGTGDPVLDLVKEHPAAVTFIGFPDFITAENKV